MVGQKIGRFQVTRQIGQGGMGAVYEAVHETIGQRVAVKVLHAEHIRRRDVANRFFDEARAASQIAHEGIVKVYDFGSLEDGTAYLIMELLRGESLHKRLREVGALPWQKALVIVQQASSALAAAHAAGVIHRDLKPDNLFLVPDPAAPQGERAKVLDFGVAKVRLQGPQVSGDDAAPTESGALLGTPRYMAPEQCRGAGAVDGAADVYALGVITFEMLAGTPPFQVQGHGAMLLAHLTQAPPSLGALRPELPAALVALVQRLLAKEPAQRPTMIALQAEVEAILSGSAAVRERPSRRPIAIGVGLGLVAVIVAGAAVGRRASRRDHEPVPVRALPSAVVPEKGDGSGVARLPLPAPVPSEPSPPTVPGASEPETSLVGRGAKVNAPRGKGRRGAAHSGSASTPAPDKSMKPAAPAVQTKEEPFAPKAVE